MKWSNEEITKLKELYPINYNILLSNIFNRSERSIISKASSLNLKKDKSHKSKAISKRNKMVGRDLSYNKLKEIALLYKTRTDFQKYDCSAYQSARVNGYLDEICKHMISQSYSIPQIILFQILCKLIGSEIIYNTRKVISPYEIDIYVPKYKIAFEYNGRKWHENDKINKEILCFEKNIKLFTIVENSRTYEEDIKKQLINFLPIINSITNLEISKEKIMEISNVDYTNNLIDIDRIESICNSYNDFNKFKKENKKIYEKLYRLKLIDKYTNHMRKRIVWNESKAEMVIRKYEYLGDLIKNNYGCYLWIRKNKKEKMLETLILKQNKKLKITDRHNH